MLKGNKSNRPLRKGYIHKLSEAMKRGEWGVTHQPIALSNGRLLDGQHRLMALVDSGLPKMFLKQLDSIIEHDNRLIGQQQMQYRVLQWAVAHKELLTPLVRDGLIECMEACLEQTRGERPKPPIEVTEEHREQGATDLQRAYPERRP